MPQSHQNWQYLGANGYVGAYTTTGGGGTPIVPRSDLDFARLGIGRAPEAEYPDGYLGTIRSRRDDRGRPTDTVLDSLKGRQTQRGYQRGVHKGERIDPAQYMWPSEMRPDRRLKQGLVNIVDNGGGVSMLMPRNAPKQELGENQMLVNDGKSNISSNVPAEFNPIVGRQFSHLRPRWN